jgi:membrane fusion protein
VTDSLFRQEALVARLDTTTGESIAIRPVSAPRLSAFFGLMAAAVVALLVFGSYTKKERVQGVLRPQAGVAAVVPLSAGVVSRVLVTEGAAVKAGDALIELTQDRFSDSGNTDTLLEQNIESQRKRLMSQAGGQQQVGSASRGAVQQRIAQARRDLVTLGEEVRLQNQQIASSQGLLDKLKPLLAEQVISDVQYEQQRSVLLDQSARLQALKRQLAATESELAQSQEELKRLSGQSQVERAGLDRDLLTLDQEKVQRRGNRVSVLRAPIDGVVSGLVAAPGQSVTAATTLASLVPSGSRLEAVLQVPSTAIGFIKPGQTVRLSYDAFPYQRFGMYRGTVASVSQTDVAPDPAAAAAPVAANDRRAFFVVKVALETDRVRAYDSEVALRPGLAVSADVELDRRRLYRWMLDPLFAFGGRL